MNVYNDLTQCFEKDPNFKFLDIDRVRISITVPLKHLEYFKKYILGSCDSQLDVKYVSYRDEDIEPKDLRNNKSSDLIIWSHPTALAYDEAQRRLPWKLLLKSDISLTLMSITNDLAEFNTVKHRYGGLMNTKIGIRNDYLLNLEALK